MSDSEAEKQVTEPVTVEGGEEQPVVEKQESQDPVAGSQSEDEDDDMGLFGDEDDDEGEGKVAENEDDEDEEIEEKVREEDLRTLEISLVRNSRSHLKEGDSTIKLQLPTYIGIEAKPFDPSKFEESVQEETENQSHLLDDKLLAENTVRWRYSTNKNGDVYRQSNTQIIEWEDGSYSLKLGSEIFDIKLKPNEDNFLVMTHDDQDILQTQDILTHTAKIVPTSTSSQVHKRLTKAIANRLAFNKQHKMKSIILDEDPDLKIKALEKLEEEAFKARRRAELKRLQEEERFERGSPAPSKRTYYSRAEEEEEEDDGIDVRKNEYDDDDGFIDDDEEEEEGYDDEEDEDELDRAAERLKKVKEAGAAKYLSLEDEEEKVTRKKRRIISDDEDE